jgi:hypothetical protein
MKMIDPRRLAVAAVFTTVCFGCAIGSLATLATAPGHLYDAINIYNDNVPAARAK